MPADTASPGPAAPARSTFVTVVAWIFIVGAGSTVCISVLQAIMFAFIFPTEAFWSASNMSLDPEQTPAVVQFMAKHMLLVFAMFWCVAIATLVAAIGLLRRRNWARLAFVGLMGLAILWNLGGLWLQLSMFSSIPAAPASAPPDFASQFERVTLAMKIASGLSAIGLSVLFAWIIKRLTSRAVRGEFNAL